jgi:hypothetical protein
MIARMERGCRILYKWVDYFSYLTNPARKYSAVWNGPLLTNVTVSEWEKTAGLFLNLAALVLFHQDENHHFQRIHHYHLFSKSIIPLQCDK